MESQKDEPLDATLPVVQEHSTEQTQTIDQDVITPRLKPEEAQKQVEKEIYIKSQRDEPAVKSLQKRELGFAKKSVPKVPQKHSSRT